MKDVKKFLKINGKLFPAIFQLLEIKRNSIPVNKKDIKKHVRNEFFNSGNHFPVGQFYKDVTRYL